VGNVKRFLTFGAAVLVAAGLGFLPMIGCVSSAEQSADEDADADEDVADVPLAPEAARTYEDRLCGKRGQRCCAHGCCKDGSTCVRLHRSLKTLCTRKPPARSVVVSGDCSGP